jgi:hypothetical protein
VTVKELIDKLQELPLDANVIFDDKYELQVSKVTHSLEWCSVCNKEHNLVRLSAFAGKIE